MSKKRVQFKKETEEAAGTIRMDEVLKRMLSMPPKKMQSEPPSEYEGLPSSIVANIEGDPVQLRMAVDDWVKQPKNRKKWGEALYMAYRGEPDLLTILMTWAIHNRALQIIADERWEYQE